MKFRKKPLVIEAVQYAPGLDAPGVCYCQSEGHGWPHVHTLEGICYEIGTGDWIICGIKGEFYPCKPDIFEATYEPLNEH